ncbi:hypothetical protein FRZ67_08270 [Panacibacter ginsenosidivorans]|uniref:Uncharacterized protein n=1 Tax=Panacibacter ginsenosidivorans TaxID=1813871 RepID=A0A5B8VAF8_9BACT|nr:hypothetical protein [Panacibacter ginsenosidivorans]QEC67288.1 hypothetical protein FRZ67_08270 [Panacibacter ginsenosidivorans]
MLSQIPMYVVIVFTLTVILTFIFLAKALHTGAKVVMVLFAWLLLNAVLGWKGFYAATGATPPHFALAVAPPLLAILVLHITTKGKAFLAKAELSILTLLGIVRIPVELVLFWLYSYKTIPQLMTFEGRNFDIVSGITAIAVFFICFKGKEVVHKNLLLTWNILGLILLLNIVINAILSVPSPIQQFAFEQPNIAVLYFPFIWLPCFIVPAVLLSHIVSLKKLITK